MSRIRLGLMFHPSREVAEVVRTILDWAMPRGAELYGAEAPMRPRRPGRTTGDIIALSPGMANNIHALHSGRPVTVVRAHATGSWALTGYRIPVPPGYGLCTASGAKRV